jgi:hypothetical protein
MSQTENMRAAAAIKESLQEIMPVIQEDAPELINKQR